MLFADEWKNISIPSVNFHNALFISMFVSCLPQLLRKQTKHFCPPSFSSSAKSRSITECKRSDFHRSKHGKPWAQLAFTTYGIFLCLERTNLESNQNSRSIDRNKVYFTSTDTVLKMQHETLCGWIHYLKINSLCFRDCKEQEIVLKSQKINNSSGGGACLQKGHIGRGIH